MQQGRVVEFRGFCPSSAYSYCPGRLELQMLCQVYESCRTASPIGAHQHLQNSPIRLGHLLAGGYQERKGNRTVFRVCYPLFFTLTNHFSLNANKRIFVRVIGNLCKCKFRLPDLLCEFLIVLCFSLELERRRKRWMRTASHTVLTSTAN